ncbi:MAG: hypothetical protein ACFB0B_12700 [Thermonemataceae bacterium]
MFPANYFETTSNGYKLFFDEIIQSICLRWKGYIPLSLHEESMLAVLDLVKERKTKLILLDTSAISFLSKENHQWVADIWLPRLADIIDESCYIAYVLSRNDFSREAVEIINEKVLTPNPQLRQKYFNNLVEARAWLFDNTSQQK